MSEVIEPGPVLFDHFARLAHDLLAVATLDRFVWVSPRWTTVLGWSEAELVTLPYNSFVHPNDVEATVEAAKALGRGEPTVRFINRYRTKSNGYRWLEWNASPADDGLLYCIARDVTDRQAVEEKLRQQAALVTMAERIFHTGHWYVDLVAETVFWSPEVYAIHGLDPDHFTPSLARGIDAYHPDDRDLVSVAVQRTIEHGESFEFEARIVRPSAEVRLVHSVGQAHFDWTGAIVGFYGVFRDITNDERVKRTQELEQFAYVASHDLRQPVRTIRAFMGALEEEHELGLDEEGQRFWGFVKRAAERLDHLVTDLARYTRASKRSEAQPVDLGAVVGRAIAAVAEEFDQRGGGLGIHGTLPTVLGDPVRLEQVFDNLFRNSLRFAGERPPRVILSWVPDAQEGTATVIVSDQGRGFEPGAAELIFEPFRRLSNDDDGGTGIGLAIVRRLVESFGGQIWAQSQPNLGATFFVRLKIG